jgi:hypothetical protein
MYFRRAVIDLSPNDFYSVRNNVARSRSPAANSDNIIVTGIQVKRTDADPCAAVHLLIDLY